MFPDRPDTWFARIGRAAFLLLVVAVIGRVSYELLTPLIPLALALVIVSLVWTALRRR